MPGPVPDPCADCGHATIHLPELGCLWSGDPYDADTDCPCAVYVPPTPVVVSSPTLERARAERDAALEQVEAAASPGWLNAAGDALDIRATTGLPFTTDDVWGDLEARGVPAPREPRALGPIVKRALRAGTIVPAGYTQSRRRHAALIRTYTGGAA